MSKNRKNLLVACAALLLTGLSAQAKTEKSCSLSTLQGSYGYTVTGFIPGSSPANVPFAAVGRIVFDGRGGVTTVRTLSAGGTVVQNDPGSGMYSVNADCTGKFTISAPPLGILSLDLVVDDDGSQIRAIVTNTGYVLTLEGRTISK